MEDYKVQSTQLEIKYCEKHKDQPYSLECKVCLNLICNRCVSGLGICSNGKGGCIVFPSLAVTTLCLLYEYEYCTIVDICMGGSSLLPPIVP